MAEDHDESLPILGLMCMKVLGHGEPLKNSGEAYSNSEIDYFWSAAEEVADRFDDRLAEQIRSRRPSRELQRALSSRACRRPVWTATGRLRAEASFCASRNTIFQGLAADGAKLAMWRLWRAGVRIVNFIHDEFLIEVPADGDLSAAVEQVESLMVEGMREVLPDVEVRVESTITRLWSKDAETLLDEAGNLLPWEEQTSESPGLKEVLAVT